MHWAQTLKLDDLTSKIGVNMERERDKQEFTKEWLVTLSPPKKEQMHHYHNLLQVADAD